MSVTAIMTLSSPTNKNECIIEDGELPEEGEIMEEEDESVLEEPSNIKASPSKKRKNLFFLGICLGSYLEFLWYFFCLSKFYRISCFVKNSFFSKQFSCLNSKYFIKYS